MFKFRLICGICLIVIIFGGCSSPQDIEPTEDLVATQVAIMLTEGAMEETPLPTETTPPTATPIKPTETPTPTASPTVTPTQTEDLSDPAIRFGSAAWTYDFSGTSSPWDFESEQARFSTSDGYLQVTAQLNPNWHSWWVSTPKLKDAYVETTIEMPNCAGFDRFGLVVRGNSEWDQFYFISVTCDSRWGFFRMTPGVEIVEITPFQETTLLSDQWEMPHRVGIWMEGSSFRFYIDGEEIGAAVDDNLPGEGYIGFLVAYAETPGFTGWVDQIQYWNLP
jgi:hypothetical protein